MSSSKKKGVLIVDDSKFARLKIKKMVNETPYAEVIGEASNGNEGIELFKKLKPDLVTMDIVMDEKGGIETIEELMEIDKSAIIVVISALGMESIILEAVKLGAKDYLNKPFLKEELFQVLERALEQKK